MSTAFVKGIGAVTTGTTANSYGVQLDVIFVHADGQYPMHNISFEASWGSDWKLLARSAIEAFACEGNQFVEPVTRIVFSDFSCL